MNRLSIRTLALLSSLVVASSALTFGQDVRQTRSLSTDASKLMGEFIEQDIRMHDSLPRGFTQPYETWTDDYSEITESGEILSKSEVRERYRASANRRPNIAPEGHVIRIYSDTAVMTHILKRRGIKKDKDGYLSVPTVYSFRVTHVFVKRDGRWQMVSTQWTPVVQTLTE